MSQGRRSLALVAVLAAVLAAGCGSDSDSDSDADSVEGPLPIGPDDPRAYTERFLDRNPRADLQPELLAVVNLEPTGGGDGDTCDAQDGVDCLPYVFAEETLLTLSSEGAPEELERMVLRDATGAAVLTQTAGSEPVSAIIPAGEYVLELRHLFAGDRDAAAPTIFLRPSEPSADATAALLESLVDPSGGAVAQAPPHSMQLTASKDCIRCNFAKAKLANQTFDGLELTLAVFDGAEMNTTSFRGAFMEGSSMRELTRPNMRSRDTVFEADFTDARLTGAHFSFQPLIAGGGAFVAIFRGAQLDTTVWELTGGDQHVCKGESFNARCSMVNPDFRNANLRASRFPAVVFRNNFLRRPNSCTFQGADLTGADFRVPSPRVGVDLNNCRFDREPESGRVTVLRGADLTGVRANGGGANGVNFSDADLSGAILERADFGTLNPNDPGPRGGALLARANLSNARIGGARFVSTDFTGATLTGITPTLAGFDLRFAVFADADFAGVDLSHTDLSQAASFRTVPPRFAGAKLSDGTSGVNLADQHFPRRYSGLKGADLTGANLTRVELLEADLEGAVLNNAQMVGANLNFANLRRAKLRGATLGVEPGRERSAASLRGALMTDIDLTDADLRSVNLTAAHLYGDVQQTLLIRTRLDSANFSNAVCSGARFSGSLSNAVFVGAQLVNTIFNGATLTNTKFDDAYLQGADFSAASGVTGASLSNAAVSAVAGTWSFTEQDGTPFTIRYEATKLGPLANDSTVRCPNGGFGPCCPSGDLMQCLTEKLKPVREGPHPPVPACVPRPPRFDNCITPRPTATPRPTPTATPRR